MRLIQDVVDVGNFLAAAIRKNFRHGSSEVRRLLRARQLLVVVSIGAAIYSRPFTLRAVSVPDRPLAARQEHRTI